MIPKRFLLISGVAVVLGGVIITILVSGQRTREVPVHVAAETKTFDSVLLTWVGNEEASQFNIYRADNPEGPYERVGFSNEEEYVDENLDAGEKYHYKVTQVVSFRESGYSARVSATTGPGKPIGVKAQPIDFHEDLELRVDIVWDYTGEIEEYRIYRTEDKGGLFRKVGATTREEYSDRDLQPESTYYYAVTQVIEGEESARSETVSATTGGTWSCGEDIEYGGKDYRTVEIGEQCWFAENVNVTEDELDRECDIERHCYDNDLGNCSVYGGLYDFSSISCGQREEGMRGICPFGWRIPTEGDWQALETEMGMRREISERYGLRGGEEGSRLAGRYDLWKEGPLRSSSNFASSGLNILPGGHQPAFNLRLFYDLGEGAFHWSSTRANEDEDCSYYEEAYTIREIKASETAIKKDCHLGVGTAQLRCVRDY